MWENIEILNLSQQKEEGIISIRTKISYYNFHRKSIININVKTQIVMNNPVC